MDGVYMMVLLHYLTRDGETVCFVCALDDVSHALHGMHEFCEFIRAQVRETRNGARRTYEDVWKETERKRVVVSV
jgi:hypothetical protein